MVVVVVVVVVAAPVVVRVVPSGAEGVAGAFAGADVVEAVVEVTGWSTHFSLSKATDVVLAEADNAAHTWNDIGHLA